jgi:hypothetical protein
MDLMTYDPTLPELPLLRGLRLDGGEPLPPLRIDWAAYVIRLAQVMAGREDRSSAA